MPLTVALTFSHRKILTIETLLLTAVLAVDRLMHSGDILIFFILLGSILFIFYYFGLFSKLASIFL